MCGRYALGVRMAFIRRRLQDQGMQVDEASGDEEVRETYNFAPGYYGAVYRTDAPGDRQNPPEDQEAADQQSQQDKETELEHGSNITYKLQAMKWGLVPFWTKRQPDYGSLMRTINCRDDSLAQDRGMWTPMKKKRRCIVVCQGFYEWLKKGPGGKEKIPHFVKRKDGELMCFAGLWDSVKYEGSDEKLYTYTIITTSSNAYLKFLHDRMPVILDPASEEMKTWLDPSRTEWSKDLQSVLKPYEGELECYPVSKEVGKVGNNSPDFLIPISSKDNKSNIANFFANAKKKEKTEPDVKVEDDVKLPGKDTDLLEQKIVKDKNEQRTTQDSEWTEDNAPLPVPGVKREHPPSEADEIGEEESKRLKTTPSPKKVADDVLKSRTGETPVASGRQTRSSTRNLTPSKKTPKRGTDASKPITAFFKK
ncbi:DUF159 domain protein [Aspergillus sclerotialis]|uniref:DUF159 domain protein n=1 Tax=Aspergillus sclerotialis TaxID=2070753 RepID=A0A3A2ZCV0_9EURO|nr:DUF159 domain protein [Aspergillus sclerotialis]